MADPASYRPRTGEIPTEPGVYRFRDEYRRVIYVGKAKSLRSRLTSYFADPATLHPRTYSMVTTAASVEWTVVTTEVEALTLEYAWIKEFDPRFNVKYRDDKSYPYLAITMNEEYPRVQVMRGAKRKGVRYFGPYSHAWAIRETVDLLLRIFPIRSCSAGVFKRAKLQDRPCLLGYIDKCSAPCVGRISAAEHRALADDFAAFMAGETRQFERRLTEQMQQASDDLEFERAARLRDDLAALRKVIEKNAVVLPDGTNADVFAMAADELEVSFQVFHVRDGRIRGQRGWISERVEDLSEPELVERLLRQVYDESAADAIPREVLVPHQVGEDMRQWLADRAGRQITVNVPQRGDKRHLMETVSRNAESALNLHKVRRGADLTSRSVALQEIQDALGMPQAPLRIECFDVSHTQGTHQVASMVVFEDGLPRKSAYRQFNITGTSGHGAADDTAAIFEAIRRRFNRYLKEQQRQQRGSSNGDDDSASSVVVAQEGTPLVRAYADDGTAAKVVAAPDSGTSENLDDTTRFAYPPSLVVIDGGLPQVNAAARALEELGVDEVAVVGLAKRLEELWLPGDEFPLILPRNSDGLFLLQRLRDEAHRFAITRHRKRRSRAMTSSALDQIAGLGPARQQDLLKHFGSLKRIRAATVVELQAVSGIGPSLAQTIHDQLRPEP